MAVKSIFFIASLGLFRHGVQENQRLAQRSRWLLEFCNGNTWGIVLAQAFGHGEIEKGSRGGKLTLDGIGGRAELKSKMNVDT